MPKGIPIWGEEFRKIRDQLLMTQSEIAKKLDISVGTVARIEREPVASISIKTIRAIAQITHASAEGVLDRLRVPQETADAIAAEQAAKPLSKAQQQSQRQGQILDQIVGDRPPTVELEPDDQLDNNVDPYSEQKFFEIPLFDLSVSAGGWTDVTEIGEIQNCNSMAQGRFRIRIAGDSMETNPPDDGYPNRSIVEFVCIRYEHQIIEVGRHYYVQKSDGTATFKMLKKITDDELVLAALNKAKYPKPLKVARQEIVRMAVAEGIFIIKGK